MKAINYNAPLTCGRFMQSASFGRLLAGPVGSGKTTACIFELLRRSCEQAPSHDGIRYTRWAIVRQTLKQLKDTVLKDIIQWLEGLVSYKVSDNTIYISMGDVKSEWVLIPLDSPGGSASIAVYAVDGSVDVGSYRDACRSSRFFIGATWPVSFGADGWCNVVWYDCRHQYAERGD